MRSRVRCCVENIQTNQVGPESVCAQTCVSDWPGVGTASSPTTWPLSTRCEERLCCYKSCAVGMDLGLVHPVIWRAVINQARQSQWLWLLHCWPPLPGRPPYAANASPISACVAPCLQTLELVLSGDGYPEDQVGGRAGGGWLFAV